MRAASRAVVASSVLVPALVAALVVARHIGTKPLWRDEAVSVSVAARPVLRILSVLPHHDANAGFYYLLLHAWRYLGDSRAWTRGLSGACFVATAALAAWGASRWRGWETGLAVGLLVAVNPFLLYYGQDARPYALAVLLATASTIALFGHADAGSVRPWPRAYVIATVALLYADLFAVLYAGALAAAIIVVYRYRGIRLPSELVRCWRWIACAAAPLAVVMVGFERGQISWLPRPSARVLADTITSMSAGWLGLEIIAVLAALALIARRDRLVVSALAVAFVVPPVGLWTLGQVTPAFIDRYVICSALALVALAGAGLAALRDRLGHAGGSAGWGRLVAFGVLAGLVVLGGQRVARIEAAPVKVDDAPAVIRFLQAHAETGDAIAYAGGGLRTVLDASLPHGTSLPLDVALAPHGQASFQHDLYAREVDAPALRARLATVERLWLVTDPGDQQYPRGGPFAQLEPLVLATFGPGPHTSFGTIDVTLLVRRP